MRLWQASFSQKDFDRIAQVKRVHGHEAEATVLRFAIREQSARDGLPSSLILEELYKRALDSCVEMRGRWKRANQNTQTQKDALTANAKRTKLVRWSFRCEDEDLSLLDLIGARRGLAKRAEALRFALYVQADLDGFLERVS